MAITDPLVYCLTSGRTSSCSRSFCRWCCGTGKGKAAVTKERQFEELTYLGQLRKLRRVAQAALDAYGLADARLKFIARSESTTYRVDSPYSALVTASDELYVDRRFLLRIHRPGYQTDASIMSELEWLAALRRDAGIAVPEPIRTVTGELLAEVTVPGVPGTRTCSLLRWVKGRLVRRGFRLDHFQALGRLMARLHQHVAHWKPPAGFSRRRWNWEGLYGDNAGFNLAANEVWELLPQPYYAPFSTVANQVRQVMDEWGNGIDAFGLIHADLSLGEEGNVVFYGGEARAIDFDDCGYGYLVYDFATSLAHWRDAVHWHRIRDAVLNGYAEIRPLPEEQLVHLGLFMAGRHVSEILWAIDMAQSNPDFREQFDDWLTFAARHVERYLGEKGET
jgi:Ser/Thr protein kinase RdoA (MazF antagonist)